MKYKLMLSLLLLWGGFIGCKNDEHSYTYKRDIAKKLIENKEETILIKYRIKNLKTKKISKWNKTYSLPDLKDKNWNYIFSSLNYLLDSPIENLSYEDVDPLMGRFGYRIHPVTLIPRNFHTGIDIYKKDKDTVKAVLEGNLEIKKDNLSGKWIKIIHPVYTLDSFVLESRYLHLKKIIKKEGKVKKGEKIGLVGGTGIMEGYIPHLHYELVLRKNKRIILLDPLLIYFNKTEKNITSKIKDKISPHAELIEIIEKTEKKNLKFLPTYLEFWKEKGKKDYKFKILVERIKEIID